MHVAHAACGQEFSAKLKEDRARDIERNARPAAITRRVRCWLGNARTRCDASRGASKGLRKETCPTGTARNPTQGL